jgi:succinate dehydrogenase hydrophobic anchor subunit
MMDADGRQGNPAPMQPEPAPVWLQRMSLVVLVFFCFVVGAFTAVLPWKQQVWDQNAWLLGHPAIQSVLLLGWVRGLVTGVGLIDIWIGVSELLHYRDFRG